MSTSSYPKRPNHTRQQSIISPPTEAFLRQIQTQSVPYTVLPRTAFSSRSKKEIVLLQSPDARYTMVYRGLMNSEGGGPAVSTAGYTYQTYVVKDAWMNREWSVYVLDANADGASYELSSSSAGSSPMSSPMKGATLKRSDSRSSSSTLSSGSSTPTYTPTTMRGEKIMVGANEQFSMDNEKVRNQVAEAFHEIISRSLSSTQIVIQ
ncbi:hypothetical protein FRB94_005364 [Tulasnella sp. JGI-2019a]|nr:hypothetical protein FRB93_007101 [Tulasnella sp. JGI-2019a]KAG9000546.1 hypothetical protein FRB94_005364 [Tulasnella sp. JGI-2019a]KAG9026196.1 hypothetical protein FRB95_009311 [Tulasnella sp. JGI-2019a]